VRAEGIVIAEPEKLPASVRFNNGDENADIFHTMLLK
jgi:hypothetical protein